ncbi:AMP-binding protein [Microbispora sp. NBC_01189]|uniref:AMP-binding protein n=1 Tax=Microbispora sp. NBC_01189 TaxID=2903583 RepID=UPI002E0FDEC2|nr:AMP-binding protein [Microbispora sp. NBC_01189]
MRPALLGWLDRPPSGTALVDRRAGRSWTYAELAADVLRRSAAIPSRRKSLVACLCHVDARSAIAYLGAMAAGHAVMMLDGAADRGAIDRLLDLYQVEFLLDGDGCERLRSPDGPPVDDELAVLLGTSGSTGSPKYVRLSRHNVDANAAQITQILEIDGDERAVQALPLHYSYGLSVLNSHLLAGASVVFPGASIVRPQFWEAMRDNACTSLAGVPYTYAILTRLGFEDAGLPDLRTLTQAGGRMEPDTVLRFGRHMTEQGGRLVVMYGQTEATARIAYVPPDRLLDKPDRVGVPVPRGHLSLADDGELLYEGPNVMLGYARGRADLASGDVNRGRLGTGDLAGVDDEGFYSIVGRKRRIAKLGGRRVNLDELEILLVTHGRVAALELSGRLVLVRAAGDATTSGRELSQHVGELIRVPTRFIHVVGVDRLPMTGTGKIDYGALTDELATGHE